MPLLGTDTIDAPLSDKAWLAAQVAAIQALLPDEAAAATAVGALVHWTDPGPGGFYDSLGET